jgi:hypothetical protein
MSEQQYRLADAAIESALDRRAPRGADRALLESIMNDVTRTPQSAGWLRSVLLSPAPRVRMAWIAILAALLLVTAAVVGGIVGPQPTDLAVVVTPGPSTQPGPTTGPTQSTPAQSLGPCVTDTLEILTGDQMTPPGGGSPLALIDQGMGVYFTSRPGPFSIELWVVRGAEGPSIRLAQVNPRLVAPWDVPDISPDGSTALIRLGEDPNQDGIACADLYEVRMDDGRVTRLTTFGSGGFVAGASYSPDGTRIAYLERQRGTLNVLDVATGTTISQPCFVPLSPDPVRIAWSPSGNRIATTCATFDATGATQPVAMPDSLFAYTWTTDDALLLATEPPTSGGIQFERHDIGGAVTILGTAADTIVPAGFSGAFSPDGQWLVLGVAVDQPEPGIADHVIPVAGGTPVNLVDQEHQRLAWSSNSRTVVYSGPDGITRVDVATLASSPIGESPGFTAGSWRFP